MLKKLLIALGGLAVAGAAYFGWNIATASAEATITIDPGQRYQVMDGWEVTLRMWEQNKQENRYDGSWLGYRDAILSELVNTAGVDRVRLEVLSGAENPVDHWSRFVNGQLSYKDWRKVRYEKINDDNDPRSVNPAGFQFSELDYKVENIVLPMRALLKARGEKLYINVCFIDFRPEGNPGNVEHALAPEEFAEIVSASFDHLRTKYGIEPDALEIILEPENTVHWRGRQIGEAMVAAAARLKESGFKPDFIAPSTTRASNAQGYFNGIIAVPGASSLISTLAYHSYDNPPDSLRRAILSLANKHKLSTAMLEHVGAGAGELYRDLTEANVSAWQQWSIAYYNAPGAETSGGSLLVVNRSRPPGKQVYLANQARTLSQYFRNIRLGATRIGAASDNSGVMPVAFVNRDGSNAVIALSRGERDISIRGLPPGRYSVSFATEAQDPFDLPEAGVSAPGEPLRVHLPGEGVVALRQQTGG